MKKQIGWRDGCELPVLDQKCWLGSTLDRKSTRLNSSHSQISYAVFCLKKKKHTLTLHRLAERQPGLPASTRVYHHLGVPDRAASDAPVRRYPAAAARLHRAHACPELGH